MPGLTRRHVLAAVAGVAAMAGHLSPGRATTPVLEVYRSSRCGCCLAWAEHMRSAGFEVTVTEVDDLAPIKRQLGVPADLEGCHTATIEGYVVEGHVPAAEVVRLLEQRPQATGLAVPGMPIGSLGMEIPGRKAESFAVILFSASGQTEFARY